MKPWLMILAFFIAIHVAAQTKSPAGPSARPGGPQRQQPQQRQVWRDPSFNLWDAGGDSVLGNGTSINRAQSEALVAAIEQRTGTKGRISLITAVNGTNLGPGSDMESILIVAQESPSGPPTALLAFVSGEYVDYKFHPQVKFIDTKDLPPLLDLHFSRVLDGEKGEDLARIVVSRAWTTEGIIRKRAGVIGFRNGSASLVEDMGTVVVDGCKANPNAYRVSANVGVQLSDDYKEKRRYYEHTVSPCGAGPSYRFQSPLDADAAYEWAMNGGRDVLR